MATNERLLYRIAHAYYEEDLTQAEIADRFGISRIKVSRLLGRARDEGIVRISVRPPEQHNTKLERGLEAAFGLDEAVVATVETDAYVEAIEAVGRAAAGYVQRVLENGHTLGLTWGKTVLATVSALAAGQFPDCRVVQMIGGLGELEAEIHGAELVRRAADRLGCRPRQLHAPAIVASESVCDALITDPQVRETLELARAANVALLGIGTLGENSVLYEPGTVLTEDDRNKLASLGIAGDIALRFFNSKGLPVANPYSARTIGVDLHELAGIQRRVGIAGGVEKAEAIYAALHGGYLNVLVTDDRTAAALLQISVEETETVQGGGR